MTDEQLARYHGDYQAGQAWKEAHAKPRPMPSPKIEQIRVFIGYDSREPIAYHVCAHSILSRASLPISITPLALPNLQRIYTRARGATESTEFAFTRFLVPYLSGYEGFSLFMDSDMLVRVDLLDLLVPVLANPGKAVYVCQHDYTPKDRTKFLGQVQTAYPKKNWSSFVLFDNAQCRNLTVAYVNGATGAELHRFQWLKDDQIGSLPLEWNWLIGEYPPNERASVLHWTTGGPWFSGYEDADHAEEWFAERDRMLGVSVPSGVAA